MASVAKLSRDRRKKNTPYYIQFYDHTGRRRTTKGCPDKGVTEAKAAKIETLVEKIKTGLANPADLEVMLGRRRVLNVQHYLNEFRRSLERKKNTTKHVELTMTRLTTVIEGCGFQSLNEFDADAVEAFLSGYCRENDLGHRTYNHYLQATDSLGNWLAHPKRRILERNPFAGIPRRNADTDVRHPRRALSTEEAKLVIAAARESQVKVRGYDGETRARIYILSYMTGLRKGEMASLVPQSFDLDASQPTVTVQAGASKRRRKDTLPLHPDLVPILREWLQNIPPGEPLFPELATRRTNIMIQKDLEAAGIPYRTDDGIADFHAAGRHTHITGLLKNGVTLVEAKELARHSDVRMTMKYTHIGLDDQAAALKALPCLHYVCDSAVIGVQQEAEGDTNGQPDGEGQDSENPGENRDSDVVCQPMTPCGVICQRAEGTGLEPATPYGAPHFQ
jgi:integrase